jgi:hypothetical protein
MGSTATTMAQFQNSKLQRYNEKVSSAYKINYECASLCPGKGLRIYCTLFIVLLTGSEIHASYSIHCFQWRSVTFQPGEAERKDGKKLRVSKA